MQSSLEVRFLESIYNFSYIDDDEQSPRLTTSSSTLSLPSTTLSTTPLDPFNVNQDEDRAPTPPPTSIIENAIEPVDLEANRSCCNSITSCKGWRYTKNVLFVLLEFFETGSITYASCLLWTYNPNHESKVIWLPIGGGGIAGLIMEILEITHSIKPKTYQHYGHIKEALAGAAAGANFVQGFMKTNNTAVAVGLLALGGLAITKAGLKFYQKRDFFRTLTGKLIRHSADGAFYLLAGAGIGAYQFTIVTGFGKNPSGLVTWGVTSAIAGTNLLANIAKKCYGEAPKISFGLLLVTFICASMYGSENALFFMLMMLDVVSEIVSTNLSDHAVYIMLSFTIAAFFTVTFKNMYHDFCGNHHEHHEEADEHTPLHTVIANRGRVEELEVVEDHRERGCIASELSSQWSNPLCFLRSRNEESTERCSWVKNLTNCLQPRSDSLLQEVRLHPIN